MKEETGIVRGAVDEHVASREVELQLPDGEWVTAYERYYLVQSDGTRLTRAGLSYQEADVIADHRWWSKDELAQTVEPVWPQDLLAMLNSSPR